jgi:hypothetical protein
VPGLIAGVLVFDQRYLVKDAADAHYFKVSKWWC